MKKIAVFVLVFAFPFSSYAASITVVTDVDSGQPFTSVDTVQLQIVSGQAGQAVFAGDGIQWLNRTGQPQIPWRVITLLLPGDVDLTTVSARLDSAMFKSVPGQYVVQPTAPMTTWQGAQATGSPDERANLDKSEPDIYQRDAFWPAETVRLLNTGQLRKWRLAKIAIPLVRYNPVRLQLLQLTEARVAVTFARTVTVRAAITSAERRDQIGRSAVQKLALNFDQAAPAYDTIAIAEQPTPKPGYTIITTSDIRNTSAVLPSFVAHKQSLGFDVRVITNDPNDDPNYNFQGGIGDTAAENIRTWLKDHYLIDHIEYVLLVGNPHPEQGDVPMKMLWPRTNATTDTDYKEAPSDFYYADLTGNWNLDGDAYYGEWPDADGDRGDFGTGGVDCFWDVLVGRIPHYGSIRDTDAILQKIIFYETPLEQSTQWRNSALLPMTPYNEDGHIPSGGSLVYTLGEAIKDDILIPNRWSYHRIYYRDFGLVPPPETTPLSYSNVSNVWSSNPFGLVVWWAHGLAYMAQDVIHTGSVPNLNDTYPSFTFEAACLNAYPEASYNLAYQLLLHGAISSIGATRYAFGPDHGPYPGTTGLAGMAYEYSDRLVAQKLTNGLALFDLKQALSLSDCDGWMNFTQFNIYGDPSQAFEPPLSFPPEGKICNLNSGEKYHYIRRAIDDAADGDRIFLRPGTYYENVDFSGKMLTLTSIDPNDPNIIAATIINGGEQRPTVTFAANEDENSILTGVTITGGRTGIYCYQTSPKIKNCIINKKESIAFDLWHLSEPTITGCDVSGDIVTRSVTDNLTTGQTYDYTSRAVDEAEPGDELVISPGVPPYAQSIDFADKNLILRSKDPNDPNIVAATVINGGWWDAVINFSGGQDSTTILAGLTITGGQTGVFCSAASPTIRNCVLKGNEGPGIKLTERSTPIVRNCLIAENHTDGIFLNWSRGSFVNCTIAANQNHGLHTDRSLPTLASCIIWANSASAIVGPASVTYSNVQGGFTGEGNINADPCFVAAGFWANASDHNLPAEPNDPNAVLFTEGDYHLLKGSPCIDSGNPDASPDEAGQSDLDGYPRFMDGNGDGVANVDMGAFEAGWFFWSCPYWPAGDIDGNGYVGASDVSSIINFYGERAAFQS